MEARQRRLARILRPPRRNRARAAPQACALLLFGRLPVAPSGREELTGQVTGAQAFPHDEAEPAALEEPWSRPDIRVATFAGPGAKAVIETVPWPSVPRKAALIKIGACGVCGT